MMHVVHVHVHALEDLGHVVRTHPHRRELDRSRVTLKEPLVGIFDHLCVHVCSCVFIPRQDEREGSQ